MKNIILITSFLFTSLCFAQNERPERDPFSLKLAVNGEQYYSMEVNKAPYFVKEKILQIYPGDKLFIETEIKQDTISSMKIVKENKFPKKTIELEFVQDTEDKAHQQMMLTVKNPFDKNLIYDAAMFRVGKDTWSKTSIIPIRPGLINFETWPDVIISLVLEKWRFEN